MSGRMRVTLTVSLTISPARQATRSVRAPVLSTQRRRSSVCALGSNRNASGRPAAAASATSASSPLALPSHGAVPIATPHGSSPAGIFLMTLHAIPCPPR